MEATMAIISIRKVEKSDVENHIADAISIIYGKLGMCSILYNIMQCNANSVTIKAEKE